ncbi:RDD family protein [Streptomyces sp. NPDC005925]|uniref:RDD family protein n=1 Tax=Streptomyces sp. NPDC005925 TaxID=3157172 RepID=UPI0033EF5CD0
MSAPTPAPGDDRPREGYYPDPSIPGYVRYWNGAAWAPGTSRPAPKDGEQLFPPPGVRPAQPAVEETGPHFVEETGPHFFDEDPVAGLGAPAPAPEDPADADDFSEVPASDDFQHGGRPEPASAWGADRSRQSGFGTDQDRRVSWGSPQTADPQTVGQQTVGQQTVGQQTADPHAADPRMTHVTGASAPDAGFPRGAAADGEGSQTGSTAQGGTFVFRGPTSGAAGATDGTGAAPAGGPTAAHAEDGTMIFRSAAPRVGRQGGRTAGAPGSAPAAPSGPQQVFPGIPPQSAAPHHPAPQPASPPTQAAPSPTSASAQTALTGGPGGGQSSWAQQVHQLASGDEQHVTPWRPPADDPFQAMVRRQTAARPAPLGKRLAARLLDTVVLGAVTAVAAVPLGTAAIDHVNEKIDAAKLSGETATVWLLDGTTSVQLGIILAVLLLAGVVLEVLPTVKWGRTLGKRLLGLDVRDIEGHEAPGFGAALRRWLVYSVPGLLVVGVVGVLWCLFDQPWRQCWHDKAAHTFVAG